MFTCWDCGYPLSITENDRYYNLELQERLCDVCFEGGHIANVEHVQCEENIEAT